MAAFLFGTVGSPTSTPKKPGGSPGAIIQIAELGLGCMELGWVQSVRVSEETCQTIKSISEKSSVALSIHAPYFINLNANDEEWPKSRKRLMDAAFFGYLAGATDIIFHPGSYFQLEPDDVLKIAIPRLQACKDELTKNKINVNLRPETMGKSALLGSFEDTLKMSEEIEGVFPCLDFAHLHARNGDGSVNSIKEWELILADYENSLGISSIQNLHIHISGIEYGPKGEKNHLPVQESDFNFGDFLSTLKSHDCGGRILIESPNLEEDALFLKNYYESI